MAVVGQVCLRTENIVARYEATVFEEKEYRRDDSNVQEHVQHNIDTGSAERDKNAYLTNEKT